MFHSGTRMSGGNIPGEKGNLINDLLDQFIEITKKEVHEKRLRSAIVRSMLPCSLTIILDKQYVWVAAEKQSGMPTTTAHDHSQNAFPSQEVYQAAKWEFGFDDPFILAFPVKLLAQGKEERAAAISAISKTHIESELQRVNNMLNTITINPIFGPASFKVDSKLVFILMPFTNDLTDVYNSIVKPTVENKENALVCRRADDIKSNKAIIQDIWKSLCEASLVIADLTGFNPNVMYELGIAHTLGKETILLHQTSSGEIKFPFDLSHIRRIEYENTAVGGRALERELNKTIQSLLSNSITS